MTPPTMRIGPEQARARIEARLGRAPQDAIEATVVLEAWGGLPTSDALEMGTAVAATPRPDGVPALPRRREVPRHAAARTASDSIALASAILVTTSWLGPLGRAFGSSAIHLAWLMALPAGVGLQWFVARRYLGDGGSVGRVRSDGPWLLASTVVALACLGLLGSAWLLAGGLAMVWVSLVVLLKRGWSLPYAGVLAGVTGALVLRPPVWVDLALLCALPLAGVVAAVGTAPATERRPEPWRLALAAGLAGALIGEIFVLGVNESLGMSPTLSLLALAPVLLGALWASAHLSRIWDLTGAPVPGLSRSSRQRRGAEGRGSQRFARRILLGALARLLAGAAVLTVMGAVASRHQHVRLPATLFAYVGIAVVALIVALFEGSGHRTWALLVAGCACAPMVMSRLGLVDLGSGGQPAILASAVGIVACLLACVHFLRDPQGALAVANL